MSRTPGASCLQDPRTSGVLLAYTIRTKDCIYNAAVLAKRAEGFDNCEPPACGYDRSIDTASVIGAFFIVANVIGVVHSLPIYFASYVLLYKISFLEFCLMTATTYLALLLAACCATGIIEYVGHKLTACFGMILIFVALVVDAQYFFVVFFHVSCVCIGIGGGLAYAAAMDLPANLFRERLRNAMLLLTVSGPLGTIFHTWFFSMLLEKIGFRWTKLMQAILILMSSLAIHIFPKTRFMYSNNCGDAGNVKDCVQKAAKQKLNPCDEECPEKSMLFVCVCDLRLYSDNSFFLWAILVMIATMMFHVSYLTINPYAETAGAGVSVWYITNYCLASCCTRVFLTYSTSFGYSYNRTVFQGALFLSGVFWILILEADTRGWVMTVSFVLGLCEGALCVTTSRLTLATIPTKWLGGAWLACIIFHAFGMFFAVILVVVLAYKTLRFSVAYTLLGIIQIVASVLIVLLPSEDAAIAEQYQLTGTGKYDPCCSTRPNFQGGMGYSKTPTYGGYGGVGCGPTSPSKTYQMKYDGGGCGPSKSYQTKYGSGCGSTNYNRYNINRPPLKSAGLVRQSARVEYKCNCSICSKYKCIPECLPDCTPGGSLRPKANNDDQNC